MIIFQKRAEEQTELQYKPKPTHTHTGIYGSTQ